MRSAAEVVETGAVVALTHEGEGIVRDGKTAFVAGALPGERIEFTRRRTHRQHDEAELLRVVEPSGSRVVPRCPHFGVCGGCALQHLEPAAQLAAKQLELLEALQRVGRAEPERWLEPLDGPAWGYRRRARLGAKYVTKKGRVVVGFRERAKPYVAELASCAILEPRAGELIQPLAEMIMRLSIRQQLPQIEVAVADATVALVLRVLQPPSAADLEELSRFEDVHRVSILLQPAGPDSITPLRPPGAVLEYRLAPWDIRLRFEATDFVQINAHINERLVTRAIELLQLDAHSRVLDLFCGLGNFTLPIARCAGAVVGVEGEARLVARARENAQRNGIGNATFHTANLEQPEPAASAWLAGPYTHVLLDPPRIGAAPMIPHLARLGAARIVYISCHPGSLARDLGALVHEHGYRLSAAGVVDMFPHTTHVESIAVLERDA